MRREREPDGDKRQEYDFFHLVNDQRAGKQRAEQIANHDCALDFHIFEPRHIAVGN